MLSDRHASIDDEWWNVCRRSIWQKTTCFDGTCLSTWLLRNFVSIHTFSLNDFRMWSVAPFSCVIYIIKKLIFWLLLFLHLLHICLQFIKACNNIQCGQIFSLTKDYPLERRIWSVAHCLGSKYLWNIFHRQEKKEKREWIFLSVFNISFQYQMIYKVTYEYKKKSSCNSSTWHREKCSYIRIILHSPFLHLFSRNMIS